jgi:hypothetical protein
MMVSSDSSFSGASWEAYATDGSFTLSVGDGSKTVYAKFKDTEGNISSAVSATSFVDTTAPTGTISINSGAATTGTRDVTLTLTSSDSGSGAATMQISDDPTFAGSVTQGFASSKSFTLSSGDGTKTVYVKYADQLGNTSTVLSDAITLSTPKSQSDNGGSGSGTADNGSGTGTNNNGGASDGGSNEGTTPQDNGGTGSGSGTNSGSQNTSGVSVKIQILDDSNKPVANAKVTLENGMVAYTNSDGVVVFDAVSEGQKNIKVEYDNKVEEKQITVSKTDANVSVKMSWSLQNGIRITEMIVLGWAGIVGVGAIGFFGIKKLRARKKKNK